MRSPSPATVTPCHSISGACRNMRGGRRCQASAIPLPLLVRWHLPTLSPRPLRSARARVRSSTSPQAAFGGWLALVTAPAMFALVGVSSTAIDVGTFWLLVELAQVPPLLANPFSYSL